MARLDILTYVWSMGDRYYKLAYRFYGDSKDWWVIAKFNQKPTESHVKIGDIILIPKPLNLVINYLRG
jgi:nucleoid-associated protein YgaU